MTDRRLRLVGLWSWLPAFRAVAEAEHLPTAARAMRVSPSALSRSVTQLEAALGSPLFVRSQRRLRLLPAGAELLGAVRDAMRRIDDGLATKPAALRIAGDATWVALLAPIDGVEVEHVELPADVPTALLRGTIDLAIQELVTRADDVVIERLGTVAQAVCTARGYAPATFATVTTTTWPLELPRTVTLRSPSLAAVIEACASGGVRAVLPTAIARARGLRVLRTPRLAPTQLYLMRRTPLGMGAVDRVVSSVHERARTLLR